MFFAFQTELGFNIYSYSVCRVVTRKFLFLNILSAHEKKKRIMIFDIYLIIFKYIV